MAKLKKSPVPRAKKVYKAQQSRERKSLMRRYVAGWQAKGDPDWSTKKKY